MNLHLTPFLKNVAFSSSERMSYLSNFGMSSFRPVAQRVHLTNKRPSLFLSVNYFHVLWQAYE